MGSLARFILSAPFALVVTLTIFLGLYNQTSSRPFLYKPSDSPQKIYFSVEDYEPFVVCNDCGWVPIPEKPDASNAWTNSEKVVKETPTPAPPKPIAKIDTIYTLTDSVQPCIGKNTLIENPPPIYPNACVKKGAEGRVTVRFDITKEGYVRSAEIIDSTDPCFNQTVLRSVERRHYPPYCTKGGVPTSRPSVVETFTFQLTD